MDHLDLTQHLPDNNSQVLVVDLYSLHSIDFLNFIHEEGLQCILSKDIKDVMGIDRSITQWLSSFDRITITDQQVSSHWYHMLVFITERVSHQDGTLTLNNIAKANYASNLSKDCSVLRPASLEQLTNTGKTTGNILRFGPFFKQLGENHTLINLHIVLSLDIGSTRQQVDCKNISLSMFLTGNLNTRLQGLKAMLGNLFLDITGFLIHLFNQRGSQLDINEVGESSLFGNNRLTERVKCYKRSFWFQIVPTLNQEL